MCDQANHDNCEIIDDLHLTITNLEMTIADLKSEIVEDLNYWLAIIERDREAKRPQYDNEYIVGDLKSKWGNK